MSILRGAFPKKTQSNSDGSGAESAASAAAPLTLQPSEAVNSALARLRKFHQGDDAGSISSEKNAPATAPASMWDVEADRDDAPAPVPARSTAGQAEADPKSSRRSGGRVRTRLLGFEHSDGVVEEIGEKPESPAGGSVRFAVGWLVIVSGPGRGSTLPLQSGVSQIGRSEDQAVPLDFGDNTISREGHAAIAYDDETRGFFLGHGGKQNIVKLNGKPVLTTESLAHGDLIHIGETVLMLATLCGPDFSWSEEAAPAKRPTE